MITTMIQTVATLELSPLQAALLEALPHPPSVHDPRTGQEYLLIRREVYEQMRAFIAPLSRNWDNPADDDLIRNDV